MNTIRKPLPALLGITLLLNLLIWGIFKFNLPHLLGYPQTSIFTVFANYDGPNYLVISRCGYSPVCIRKSFSLPSYLQYYPAHLPGYPAIISLFHQLTPGPWAMLLATLAGNLLLVVAFYRLANLYCDKQTAFYLSLLFTIFPGRMFALKMVGSPESWFVASILLSIFYFKKEKFIVSALFLALAQSLKSPAIILLAAFCLHAITTHKIGKIIPHVLFSAFTLVIVFAIYQFQTGDFLAYFHSGDNRHLSLIPFQAFIGNQSWVGTFWLEEILYIFLLAFVSIYYLQKQFQTDIVLIFSWLFTLALVFVGHRDISRYAAPLYPMFYLSFHKTLVNKHTRFLFLLLLPAVVLYAVNFILGNVAPVADWTPYL